VLASHSTSPNIALQNQLALASQSITARGLALYTAAPDKYARLNALPFPAYIPALSEDLKTPEFSALLSSAGLLYGQASQGLAPSELEALRQRFFETVWQTAAAQTWFPQEGGHALRVARNAAALASRLGYSDLEVHEIYWGGLLHDLGKLFVGELFVALVDQGSPFQATLPFIRAHASLGGNFLESVHPLFPTALLCAAQHQESVDGSGYPNGLHYEQLALPGQIVNLADGYDATVTRFGWSASQITADIQGMYTRAGYLQAPILQAFTQLIEECHTELYPP
jgi:response regulator RpfG family c-di-GMP phosphodiesterase